MLIRFSFGNAKLKPSFWGFKRAALLWLLLTWSLSISVAQNVEIIDNKDSRVRYGKGWTDVPGPHQRGGSVMLARRAMAVAQVTFQGIGISVYGTQGTKGGNVTKSLYVIDATTAVEYVVPPTLREIQYHARFFQSPRLADDEHTLVIVNENEDGWYWLDYFEVTSAGTQSATPTSSVGSAAVKPTHPTPVQHSSRKTVGGSQADISTSSNSSSAPSSSASSDAQSGSSEVPSQMPSSRPAVSPGAAVGIALSSAILVALGVFVVWWQIRHRSTNDDTLDAQNIDPFYRGSSTGPVIHGVSTPYMVEHFPAPGTSLPPPPRLAPEKHPVVASSQSSHLLDYHGEGLPPGAGTPQIRQGVFQSFGEASLGVLKHQGQDQARSSTLQVASGGLPNAEKLSSLVSTNRATYGSEDATQLQQPQRQKSHRPVLLS